MGVGGGIREQRGLSWAARNRIHTVKIWASDFIPNEVATEDAEQKRWLDENSRNLLVTYAARESERKERVVVENDYWISVVPWWAVWPFETLLMPRRHVLRVTRPD